MYNTVLFDLDGTLTDSAPGIINSVKYALKKLNIEVNEKTLNNFIGPPLINSFAKYYGMTQEESRNAVNIYREYFADKGMFENSVYPGIEDSLKKLKEAGKRLLVCTAKPEVFAETILKHFHLDGYFDYIGGSLMDETRTSKYEVMEYLIQLGLAGLERIIAQKGFSKSPLVDAEINEYKEYNNPVLSFLKDVELDDILHNDTKTVHSQYEMFCHDNGFQMMGLANFTKEVNRQLDLRVRETHRNGKKVRLFERL